MQCSNDWFLVDSGTWGIVPMERIVAALTTTTGFYASLPTVKFPHTMDTQMRRPNDLVLHDHGCAFSHMISCRPNTTPAHHNGYPYLIHAVSRPSPALYRFNANSRRSLCTTIGSGYPAFLAVWPSPRPYGSWIAFPLMMRSSGIHFRMYSPSESNFSLCKSGLKIPGERAYQCLIIRRPP